MSDGLYSVNMSRWLHHNRRRPRSSKSSLPYVKVTYGHVVTGAGKAGATLLYTAIGSRCAKAIVMCIRIGCSAMMVTTGRWVAGFVEPRLGGLLCTQEPYFPQQRGTELIGAQFPVSHGLDLSVLFGLDDDHWRLFAGGFVDV